VALEVALRYSEELLIGVTSLLIIIPLITAGSDCDSLGLPFQPPLVAFGAPLTAGSHLPTALDKDDPNRLLTRGMPGGDVEELLRALWLVTTELMHYGSIVHVRPQCWDDVDVAYLEEFMALLRETLDVIPYGFTLLLPVALQIPRVAGPHVGALEVFGEDLLEILPTIDRVSGQVIESNPSRVG
jgi:hypothetical protein